MMQKKWLNWFFTRLGKNNSLDDAKFVLEGPLTCICEGGDTDDVQIWDDINQLLHDRVRVTIEVIK